MVAKQLQCVRYAPQIRHVTPIFTSSRLVKNEGPLQSSSLAESPYNALINVAKGHDHLAQRERFSLALKEFVNREKFLRGHVDFITLALHRMDEFGLQQDLLSYNRLLDIIPKGRYKPKNLLDVVWPRPLPQIDLALRLQTKMEEHGVTTFCAKC